MSYRRSDGIVIPEETARAEAVPDDLDAGAPGPYRFPDPGRRRWAAWIYLAMAGLLAGLALSEPGLWITALLLAAIGAYQWWASWPLVLDQAGALQTAAARVPFGVGHASVAVTFAGIRSRPRWQVIVYSSESPPKRRALVEIDGVTGESPEDVFIEDLEPPQT